MNILALKHALEEFLILEDAMAITQDIKINLEILNHQDLPVILAHLSDEKVKIDISISMTEEQIICISHLCRLDEIQTNKKDELNQMMLRMNIPLPLSSYAIYGAHYVILGALSRDSKIENIVYELVMQFHNTVESLEMVEPYLI